MSTESEIATVPQCYTHTDRPAEGFCVSCGKPICTECTVEIEGKNNCKNCVAEKLAPPAQSSSQLLSWFSNKQWMGLGGCVLLLIGVFAPLVSFINARPNYFGMGGDLFQKPGSDGTIILVLTVASVVILLKKKLGLLWITAAVIFGIIVIDLNKLYTVVIKPVGGMLEWGWLALFVGTALLFAAAWNSKDAQT